jgi:hypothetical protein
LLFLADWCNDRHALLFGVATKHEPVLDTSDVDDFARFRRRVPQFRVESRESCSDADASYDACKVCATALHKSHGPPTATPTPPEDNSFAPGCSGFVPGTTDPTCGFFILRVHFAHSANLSTLDCLTAPTVASLTSDRTHLNRYASISSPSITLNT